MKNIMLLIAAFLLLAANIHASDSGIRHPVRRGDFTPQPRLIAPATEAVVLTGKKELEFKWSPHEARSGFRDHYDFRLYKGYDMVEKALIVKEKVAPNAHRINISADRFDDGQVYTWSLRQVYDGLRKSERSAASFKVIKR